MILATNSRAKLSRPQKNNGKYQGINISDDLSWSKHINQITVKENNTLKFIKRNIAGSGRAVLGVGLSFCACFRMIIYPCGDTHGGTCIWDGWVRIGVARAEAVRAVSRWWDMGVKGNAA